MMLNAQLLEWYKKNKRDLPWRQTKNPYFIWISEIILQQTRVAQGEGYYHRFIKKFPDLKSLAMAKEDQVLAIWQGLGYYSRARNMYTAAKYIYKELNNQFPRSYSELIKLKGIGPYTAAAIASLAFNERVAAIDGNVYRVLSRYLGLAMLMDSSENKKAFYEAAMELMDSNDPGTSNQALIELGALVCTPVQPRCHECPFKDSCYALLKNKITSLPVKKKSGKQEKRHFHFLLISYKGKIAVRKRTGNDIWKSLYEFPMIETSRPISAKDLFKDENWMKLFKDTDITIKKVSGNIKHILTHQILFSRFFHIDILDNDFSYPADWKFINKSHLNKYVFPVLIVRYLTSEGLL